MSSAILGDLSDLRTKLNLETARLSWTELARYFAGGRLVRVDADLDLLEVAEAMAEDHSARVSCWLEAGAVASVSDDEARRWHAADAQLWAVVIKPWVLVQATGAPSP